MMIYGKRVLVRTFLHKKKKNYFTKSEISEVSRDTEDLSNGFRKFSFASQKYIQIGKFFNSHYCLLQVFFPNSFKKRKTLLTSNFWTVVYSQVQNNIWDHIANLVLKRLFKTGKKFYKNKESKMIAC